MDWAQVYGANETLVPVIINKGFTTTIFAAAAMSVMIFLFRKEADTLYLNSLTNKSIRLFYLIASIALFFIAGAFEISYQFSHRFAGTGLEYVYLQMYVMGFFLLLFFILSMFKAEVDYYVKTGIPLILFVLYMFNIPNSYAAEKLLLTTGNMKVHFIAHWLGIFFLIILIRQTIVYVRTNNERLKSILNGFSSVGIVWGVLSFILIWLGMNYNFKPLRIVALVLFGITLIKLFAFDIKNIPPGGKIIAFILLGILLLIVSFMYQRLKKLIIDDTSEKQ